MLISICVEAQEWTQQMGLGYTYMAPMGTMKKNISRGNGFTMDYFFVPQNSRLAVGADFAFTIYGHDKERQLYTFSDGTQADMDIVVNNSIVNLSVAGRYFLKDESIFRPYIIFKGGYSWFRTDLNIYDPDDWDQCEPVDDDVLLKDGTFTVSGGGGFQWDMSGVFKKLNPNRILFSLSANIVLGGSVKYMNTDAPTMHNQPTTDVRARFINTQTQVVHEHHVGYVYSSYVEMIEVRAGLAFNIIRQTPYFPSY